MTVDESRDWVRVVARLCDRVFESADVGFERQTSNDPGAEVLSLLWEADPHQFAARYRDSGIIDSYGAAQWEHVHCIDYWVNVDLRARKVEISTEGWDFRVQTVDLTGDGQHDGEVIASILAEILRVPPPTDTERL